MSQNGHRTRTPVPAADTRHLTDLPRDAVRTRRETDRAAMRRLLEARGFDHAVESIGNALAVELVDQSGRDADQRLEETAGRAEAVVLDALVYFARSSGWKASR